MPYRLDTFLKSIHPCIMEESFCNPIQRQVTPGGRSEA